jgi:hypothetical protein
MVGDNIAPTAFTRNFDPVRERSVEFAPLRKPRAAHCQVDDRQGSHRATDTGRADEVIE